MKKFDKTFNNLLSCNMAINLCILGFFIKGRILDNVNNKIIITKNRVGCVHKDLETSNETINILLKFIDQIR